MLVMDRDRCQGVGDWEGTVFSDQLASWDAFATLLGGAAATLMGLLFIAVSINSRAVTEMGDKDARMLAVNTFAGFLFLLVYALYLLVPNQSADSLGWSFLVSAIIQSRISLEEAVRIWRSNPSRTNTLHIVLRQTLPLASAVLIGIVGVLLIGGWSTDLDLLLYAFFSLLIGSTVNAWFLLLRISSPATPDVG